MATSGSVHLHFDVGDIGHEHTPSYSTLDIGGRRDDVRASLYFPDTAAVDKAIAELVALRQEMAPPVITDSERTCDERNPDGSGEPCHRGGDHGVHRDTDGEEWRTDGPGGVLVGPFADDDETAKAAS